MDININKTDNIYGEHRSDKDKKIEIKTSDNKNIDYIKSNHPGEMLGRSMVTFKGSHNSAENKENIQESEQKSIKDRITDMSDEEFELLKAQIEEKLSSLPDDIKEMFSDREITKENIFIFDKVLSNKRLYENRKHMSDASLIIFEATTAEITEFACNLFDTIIKNEEFDEKKAELQDKISSLPDDVRQLSDSIYISNTNIDVFDKIVQNEKLYNDKEFINKYAQGILRNSFTPERAETANLILSNEKLISDKKFMKDAGFITGITSSAERTNIVNKILSEEKLFACDNLAKKIIKAENTFDSPEKLEIFTDMADKILADKKLSGKPEFMKDAFDIILSADTIQKAKVKSEIIDKIGSDKRLIENKNFIDCIGSLIVQIDNEEEKEKAFNIISNEALTPQQAVLSLTKPGSVNIEDLEYLNKKIGIENANKLSLKDNEIAADFADTYKLNNINEMRADLKKDFLKKLISTDSDLFNMSDEMKNMFPVLPSSQEEYCEIIPSLTRSLGIETAVSDDSVIEKFYNDLNSLSDSLSALSDEDFASLDIGMEYSKNEFIKDVFSFVKNLPEKERQKVFDFFGFELHRNKKANVFIDSDGYSLSGYPANPDNNSKLSAVTDSNTREIIEGLRPFVIKFSQNNEIYCNNSEIGELLNSIIDVLPELRPQAGKTQHGSHDFDIFKHSLKVMKKIKENPEFENLNDSDKKIMLLSALLHDITKKEGNIDKTHASESAFDSFFIAKKFNLSHDDLTKLYTLEKNHEWLEFVNTAKSSEERQKRLQSVAYDLRYDNLFDMSLIFTKADLAAVKKDDSFLTKSSGRGRTDFEGVTRSFGDAADFFAGNADDDINSETIRGYINELKKSQPLLPVTKFPGASDIDKAIEYVNDDGSTDIKGVYKNKQGLVIINYNEVDNDDWQKIGFPKGSISTGIKADGKHRDRFWQEGDDPVDTGNIKFFAHGLEYPNQLAKFDAFHMPDSDVLLSVSYAERPESKYRFFRPQGIILDTDTKYIHGGGETDAGSGCGKSIQNFKDGYIFGGFREKDRLFISRLIKQALNLNDNEYADFVKQNENKSFNEIEPVEVREKLIKAFSSINSKTRSGNRQYNEMYVSNPKPPMAVFAYSSDYDLNIDNPVKFLNGEITSPYEHGAEKRTRFLQDYAIERDIPFIVFSPAKRV